MNSKLVMTVALSLTLTANTDSTKAATSVPLLPSHPVAPMLNNSALTYFGVPTYSVQGTTLVLAMDRKACSTLLKARHKLDYSLNKVSNGLRCQKTNIVEVKNFFLADLLNEQRR